MYLRSVGAPRPIKGLFGGVAIGAAFALVLRPHGLKDQGAASGPRRPLAWEDVGTASRVSAVVRRQAGSVPFVQPVFKGPVRARNLLMSGLEDGRLRLGAEGARPGAPNIHTPCRRQSRFDRTPSPHWTTSSPKSGRMNFRVIRSDSPMARKGRVSKRGSGGRPRGAVRKTGGKVQTPKG